MIDLRNGVSDDPKQRTNDGGAVYQHHSIGKLTNAIAIFSQLSAACIEAERTYVPLYEIQKRSALDGNLLNHLSRLKIIPIKLKTAAGNRLGFN
nr:hypothetical protein [Bacillus subtilis]MDH3147030.1 hypothetical protein [Bacillus subtilis]